MTDNLRDRIAAAIDQKYNEEAIGHTYEVCLQAADAVIAELKSPQPCRNCGCPLVRDWTGWQDDDAVNELTAGDSSKKLVRIWDRSYNLRGQQFVHWNNGFTIDATDPIAVELWNNREMLHQVTVESTSELAWCIDRLDRTSDGLLVVTCQPHLDVLRKALVTDAYLVDLWLAAEKRCE